MGFKSHIVCVRVVCWFGTYMSQKPDSVLKSSRTIRLDQNKALAKVSIDGLSPGAKGRKPFDFQVSRTFAKACPYFSHIFKRPDVSYKHACVCVRVFLCC